MSRKSCNKLGKKTSVLAINPEQNKNPSFQSAGVLGDIFQGRSLSKFAPQNANKEKKRITFFDGSPTVIDEEEFVRQAAIKKMIRLSSIYF